MLLLVIQGMDFTLEMKTNLSFENRSISVLSPATLVCIWNALRKFGCWDPTYILHLMPKDVPL